MSEQQTITLKEYQHNISYIQNYLTKNPKYINLSKDIGYYILRFIYSDLIINVNMDTVVELLRFLYCIVPHSYRNQHGMFKFDRTILTCLSERYKRTER